MCRFLSKILTVLIILLLGFACAQSAKTYNPPEKKDLGDNNYEYIDSPFMQDQKPGLSIRSWVQLRRR